MLCFIRFYDRCLYTFVRFAYLIICCSLISFTNFIKSLSLLVTFLLNFRHGLSMYRFNFYMSAYKTIVLSGISKISKWWNWKTLQMKKVGRTYCHMTVTWYDGTPRLVTSRTLIFLFQNIATGPNSFKYKSIFCPNEEINCNEYFFCNVFSWMFWRTLLVGSGYPDVIFRCFSIACTY